MTTMRRFTCDDLFTFNPINLDFFTETVSCIIAFPLKVANLRKLPTSSWLWHVQTRRGLAQHFSQVSHNNRSALRISAFGIATNNCAQSAVQRRRELDEYGRSGPPNDASIVAIALTNSFKRVKEPSDNFVVIAMPWAQIAGGRPCPGPPPAVLPGFKTILTGNRSSEIARPATKPHGGNLIIRL